MFGFPFAGELSGTEEISTRNSDSELKASYNTWKSNNETLLK